MHYNVLHEMRNQDCSETARFEIILNSFEALLHKQSGVTSLNRHLFCKIFLMSSPDLVSVFTVLYNHLVFMYTMIR